MTIFYSLYRDADNWIIFRVEQRDEETVSGTLMVATENGWSDGDHVVASSDDWFGIYADASEAVAGRERIARRSKLVIGGNYAR